MENLLTKLNKKHILVGDGAMGSMLMDRGLSAGECPESWNIKFPQKILDIHKAYIEAGSDIILTNTFGANRLKLCKFGLEGDIIKINKEALRIAKSARAGKDVFVLADIGPTGAILKPYGDMSEEELYEIYKEQLEILVNEGADGIILETFSSLEEIKVAFDASRFEEDLPIIGSMTFQKTKRGFYTMMGVDVEKAVIGMANAGCNIIGSNCGLTIEDMVQLTRQIRAQLDDLNIADTFIIAQPNAGMPQLEGDKTVFKETVDKFTKFIKPLADAGASIIGGCCGTNPQHIKAIKKELSQ